ncbi:disulfide bond formation protein B [Hydrogenophaga sp. YM1]|mgnify:CR=1 FL=1|uniref:disulfide bond formation protein B n=1 Tax=unclassified Hydrogenophaga TaxID=2610897 RepID=UPI00086839F5|nr:MULTISPECIES: disulfide bond formation protein B [unclassified Hydrogenophaga]MBN9371476.1 disulfide bond formation protein B [Hydrogenophaga sp.]ODT33087.1 MAG: disulfide bond formation protein B [Hydrogenophaga sp. SCN 70-13]OJV71577.1 MAG: disulfide bond formation protein B [Hydrogenophaga sp. 70-12]QRR32869.1 disulfide bond formation protein B [Hydrogenophaga sp. YM1]
MNGLLALPGQRPRRVLALIAAVSVALLAFGMYLQHVVGLEPCPMCIVQRYALILVAVLAGVAACLRSPVARASGVSLMGLFAAFGAFTAARQSWLQWNPPEIMACGRDFFGMIEAFPLGRAIPMIFRGSGDCAKVDWTFLGLTIANWSFLWFVAFGGLAAWMLLARRRAAA